MLRIRLAGLMLVLVSAAWATPGPLPVEACGLDQSFEELKAEADGARKKLVEDYQEKVRAILEAHERAVREAKTDEEKARAASMPALPAFSITQGLESFSPRFLDWSNKHMDDPQSFDAAVMALETSGRLGGDVLAFDRALETLRTRFATDSRIRPVLKSLGRQHVAGSEQLLREVGARHPDRKTQDLAFKSLANSLRAGVALAEFARGPHGKSAIKQLGQKYVDGEIAGVDWNRQEAENLEALLSRSYADVLPNLSVGQPAPEVVSRTVDGQPARLSELRGKVVVLDIWATWCGPCVAMIPHERAMVERLKDDPFVLVSISADEELETLKEFLGKEPMPWPQWWSGRDGGIVEDWDVEQFPTTYLIDAKGIIRFKDLRDEELETAVRGLLKEARGG